MRCFPTLCSVVTSQYTQVDPGSGFRRVVPTARGPCSPRRGPGPRARTGSASGPWPLLR